MSLSAAPDEQKQIFTLQEQEVLLAICALELDEALRAGQGAQVALWEAIQAKLERNA